ncbi:MAG TPA: aminotransferase class V-fold PLP-dependent enzyme, partial [Bacillota bacterium]
MPASAPGPAAPGPAVDSRRLAAVRAALPSVEAYAYLNTGTCGPVPLPAAEALSARWHADVHGGRITPERFRALFETLEETRRAVGDLLGAGIEEVALTTSTTHGINIALWGLRWSPGDEILTTLHEHPGLQVPLADISRRHGVVVRPVDCDPADPDDVVAAFRR